MSCSPTCSKAVSPQSQAKENEYRPEVRVKMGTAENGLSRVARHFSQLIDGKLPCSSRRSGDDIFWLRNQITKTQNLLNNIKIIKKVQHFCQKGQILIGHQIFLLYGIVQS